MNDINQAGNENGGTMQFSLSKTKHVDIKKPAKRIDIAAQEEEHSNAEASEQEQALLQNQVPPTEFEDVFSDEEKEEEEAVTESVVSVEEVFKQNAAMINENFHDGTQDEPEPVHNSKLKKIAIILGIISGAVILAAIAIGLIILL